MPFFSSISVARVFFDMKSPRRWAKVGPGMAIWHDADLPLPTLPTPGRRDGMGNGGASAAFMPKRQAAVAALRLRCRGAQLRPVLRVPPAAGDDDAFGDDAPVAGHALADGVFVVEPAL